MPQLFSFWQGIYSLFLAEPAVAIGRIVLIALGILFIYLGYKGILEPIIMIPLGLGSIGVNAGVLIFEGGRLGNLFIDPLITGTEPLMNILQIDFLQPIFTFTFSNGLIACLVFMGIGAITEIDFLIAKPLPSMLLAACAEFGTVFTLPIGILMGLAPNEAAAISLVGGADGPMVLFASLILAKDLFVPITIVAYIYLSLCYAGYPYLIKLLIPKKLRGLTMDFKTIPQVSSGEKFAFAIAAATILCLLFPVAAPLFISFFVGLAVKESGMTRIHQFLEGTVLWGSTFFLGLTLGALLSADTILNPKVLILLVLGSLSLLLSGIGGLVGGLIYYRISRGRVNPLIGIAGVSCIPTTAKVAQKCAQQANKFCMILPFALGPSVAGVITTAIVTGIFVSGMSFLK